MRPSWMEYATQLYVVNNLYVYVIIEHDTHIVPLNLEFRFGDNREP